MANVQLMHPGIQKKYPSDGYIQCEDQSIIRLWNTERQHYRKFILQRGEFLVSLSDNDPKSANLFFWGEWEGHSHFTPFPKNNKNVLLPNGEHKPFHSRQAMGSQNTDPYVFGDCFKYATCLQGKQTIYEFGDLLLFGTVYPKKKNGIFCIDTVFVVNNYQPAGKVTISDYSKNYQEETLGRICSSSCCISSNNNYTKTENKLYRALMYKDNKEYFSFVPCKLDNNGKIGFERLTFELNTTPPFFSKKSQKTARFAKNLSTQEVWNKIVNECLIQDYKLGIHIEEPPIIKSPYLDKTHNLIQGQSCCLKSCT